jgi:hypothetical protein
MVDAAGRVRLLDFGIAKVIASPDIAADLSTTSVQTTGNKLLGTPGYMSPSRFSSDRSTAVGSVLAWCAPVRVPHRKAAVQRAHTGGTVANVLHVQLPPPSTLRKGSPIATMPLCERLLAKEPAESLPVGRRGRRCHPIAVAGHEPRHRAQCRRRRSWQPPGFRWLIAAVVVLLGFIAWRTTRPTGLPPVPAEAQLWYQRGPRRSARARISGPEATSKRPRGSSIGMRSPTRGWPKRTLNWTTRAAAQRRLLRLSDLGAR